MKITLSDEEKRKTRESYSEFSSGFSCVKTYSYLQAFLHKSPKIREDWNQETINNSCQTIRCGSHLLEMETGSSKNRIFPQKESSPEKKMLTISKTRNKYRLKSWKQSPALYKKITASTKKCFWKIAGDPENRPNPGSLQFPPEETVITRSNYEVRHLKWKGEVKTRKWNHPSVVR